MASKSVTPHQVAPRLVAGLGGHLALLDAAIEELAHPAQALVERAAVDFTHDGLVSRRRAHLRDTRTHQAAAKHAHRLNRHRQSLSTIAAIPCPPPMHAVARPYFLFRRPSSCVSVSKSRVPVMPSGWPSAIAPPFTFVFSRSSPSSFSTARVLTGERFVHFDEIDLIEFQSGDLEGLPRRRRWAHSHVGRIHADGRPGDHSRDRLQALFLHRRFRRQDQGRAAVHDAARVARRDRCLLGKRAGKFASRHRVSGRNVIVAILDHHALAALELDRRTSSWNLPSAHLWYAACWLRNAYSSCSSRVIPYFDAHFSAVCAMNRPQ
jgi:GNAT superfamily N-acetyltransferase